MNPRPSLAVLDLAARDDLGLAPHYLSVWSAVVGLEASRTFEFGAGGSTAVILDALRHTPGPAVHRSVSTESADGIARRFEIAAGVPWGHRHGRSAELYWERPPEEPFDFVLHDGSHAADTVEADLRWALPHLRRWGLCFVHDSQHSYVGAEVRRALGNILRDPPHDLIGGGVLTLSHTTLTYGFGLTVIRRESLWPGVDPVAPKRVKVGSLHKTAPCPVEV